MEKAIGQSGIGIQVQDATLTSLDTISNYEIHNNYIHNTKYSGMYLGHNKPWESDEPFISGFSIHDNILEDLGSYGITYKGVNGPNNFIYNNTVRQTGIVNIENAGSGQHGIGVQYHTGNYYTEIFNNTIEETAGPGIKINAKSLTYNNVIFGCGTGRDTGWGHGIVTMWDANGAEIYDNIIIQAKGYGIYGKNGNLNIIKRNYIGDCGDGEWSGSGVVEATGSDANIYKSDVADFNFPKWSNDFNYSNDVLKFDANVLPPANLRIAIQN
jgi:hypothetical protein